MESGERTRDYMKKRKELREAVAESANRIKSNIYLGMLLEASELFRKASDNKEYAELTDLQWKQRSIICSVLDLEDAEKAANISCFINAYTRK